MFRNEALADFSLGNVRQAYALAISDFRHSLQNGPRLVKPLLDGQAVDSTGSYVRYDPADNSTAISRVFMANEAQAMRSIDLAAGAFERWSKVSVAERSQCLRNAARIMREKRLELFALMLHEAGKPWKETEADICEAIDFCEYYAGQMDRLSQACTLGTVAGEENIYFYKARGIAVVISPWNFPLAITCGMAAAALVTGNTVIVKPSRQTSAIAEELCKIFIEAGVIPSAISFLPGPGSLVGRLLVEDPRVSLYAFTGSKEVGLDIIARAAVVKPGQRHVKRVIAEMGGKNAIVVDDDADLDEAVKGIIYSAFGYSGQKCSACSRVIAVGQVYPQLMERLRQAVADIISGPARDPATLLGPVIDQASQDRIMAVISEAEKTEKLLVKTGQAQGGYFVPAAVFCDVSVDSYIWREEIFGPVLACRRAEDFAEAIRLVNDSDYALTAGVYSRSPTHIRYARENIEAGNIYINRGCTGAMVERHPFGGFKLSGIGSKAGGKDYLLQFLEPRAISENTMRRGFAPQPD